MTNPPLPTAYADREQTKAKHFILQRYLQELAFKVMHHWDIAYIDGFSGPWESQTLDFSDTSFMIAIKVLEDAQERIYATTGHRRRVVCFFSESNAAAYKQLSAAVAAHNQPLRGFEIRTYHGEFVNAVSQIKAAVGQQAFPLIFIDPTGWTGYPFDRISSIFEYPKCEVIINFMYDHVNRFINSPDEATINSLNPNLGGPGWQQRLDPTLQRGPAVEKLFRETLGRAGSFPFVISTKIDKSTADRPHFFLAYGTKSRHGLKAFRQIEYDALRQHARDRSDARERKREQRTGSADLFQDFHADVQEAGINEIVAEQKALASRHVLDMVRQDQPLKFSAVVDSVLQKFMLREPNVKDICVQLARKGLIVNTWGAGNRKPNDETLIQS